MKNQTGAWAGRGSVNATRGLVAVGRHAGNETFQLEKLPHVGRERRLVLDHEHAVGAAGGSGEGGPFMGFAPGPQVFALRGA